MTIRYALRLTVEKNQPVYGYYIRTVRHRPTRGDFGRVVKRLIHGIDGAQTWANRETAQRWADQLSLTVGDTVYSRYEVELRCQCMTEDPGDGYGERVAIHSSTCPLHPEYDAT